MPRWAVRRDLLALSLLVSIAVPGRLHGERAAGPSLTATTPSTAFDREGRLWAVWSEHDHVFVARSHDDGTTFTAPVQVTPRPEPLDANGESRTKVALGPNGEIYVTWTRSGEQRFTGDIRFARSVDGGRTFSTPVTVNDDRRETGHRFDALHVGPTGIVYIVWIDKRDLDRATDAGHDYAGAALYATWSRDRGDTFVTNRKLKDHICECCRIAIDSDGEVPVLVWRDVIDGAIRDHGLLRFVSPTDPGPPRRATTDDWRIDACPHHGPSLSVGADGSYHLVWFTGDGPRGPGAFYARSTDRGERWTDVRRLDGERQASHAVVLSHGSRVVIAHREFLPPLGARIVAQQSVDGGRTWQAPFEAARSATGGADHPLLVARDGDIRLSWFTRDHGLRVLALTPLVSR